MNKYHEHITSPTPQSEAAQGKEHLQEQNNAGGFVFAVDCWTRLDRFLILGCEGGSYYCDARKMTKENVSAITECLAVDADRTIGTIVSYSVNNRAIKNDTCVFALAVASVSEDTRTRLIAFQAISEVCRIPTHLFDFLSARKALGGGWGRAFKKAIQNWYLHKDPQDLAYAVTKYRQRNGWTHADVLRLAKPSKGSLAHKAVFRFATGKDRGGAQVAVIHGFKQAQEAAINELPALIREFRLTREMLPTEALADRCVQAALLEKTPATALIRNLGSFSKSGLLKPLSPAEKQVVEKLGDSEWLRKSKVHPFSLLLAYKNYAAGRGFRGDGTWDVSQNVVNALDKAFYAAFDNVEPVGKNFYLGIDCSGSMSWTINNTNISCREAAAVLAMVTVKTEPYTYVRGFTGGWGSNAALTDLGITASDSLSSAIKKTNRSDWGSTDCALPMLDALQKELDVDVFIVLTDNETWAGSIHPFEALKQYRKKMNKPNAKLIVVGMTASRFSIADPTDPGMLDIVGFDTNAPQAIAEFARL